MGTNRCSNYSISSGTRKMSDNFHPRLFLGDFNRSPQAKPILGHFQGKRPLAEEFEVVLIGAIRRCFGKKALIDLIRRHAPLELPLPGGSANVNLTYDLHHLPGPIVRKSMLEDRTARLWLVCPGCHRRVQKLFYMLWDATRGSRSELLCRLCNGLTYQASNCGGNKWYRTVGRPLKHLLQQREKLLCLKPSPRRNRMLQVVEINLDLVRGRSGPRNRCHKRKHPSSSDRRPSRDVTLIEKYFS
jgi:hypothetical protein